MLTEAELVGMRETSDTALPDEGTITRPVAAGTGVLDPLTGVWTPTAATVVYAGACRVRPPTAEEFERVFGDAQVTETRYIGTFPASLPAVLVGDVLNVTTGSDPHIVGIPFRITRLPSGSWLIDRRLGLEVIV